MSSLINSDLGSLGLWQCWQLCRRSIRWVSILFILKTEKVFNANCLRLISPSKRSTTRPKSRVEEFHHSQTTLSSNSSRAEKCWSREMILYVMTKFYLLSPESWLFTFVKVCLVMIFHIKYRDRIWLDRERKSRPLSTKMSFANLWIQLCCEDLGPQRRVPIRTLTPPKSQRTKVVLLPGSAQSPAARQSW